MIEPCFQDDINQYQSYLPYLIFPSVQLVYDLFWACYRLLLLSQTCSAPSRDGSATSKSAQCEAPPAADPDRCTSAWLGAAVPVPGKPPKTVFTKVRSCLKFSSFIQFQNGSCCCRKAV